MAEFKTIETQEELNAIIGSRLKKAEEKYAEENASIKKQLEEMKNSSDALQAQLGALNLQYSEANETIKTKDAEIKKFETMQHKTKIAKEFGIPDVLMDRLSGEDEESMRKDAEALSNALKETRPTPPMADYESSSKQEQDNDKKLRGMLKDMLGN